MNKIQELEEQIKKFSIQLEELKLSAKEEEFKVGDWVVNIDLVLWNSAADGAKNYRSKEPFVGRISTIGFCKTTKQLAYSINIDGNCCGKSKEQIRRATQLEIENFLISEAEKKGFVKGAKVRDKTHSNTEEIEYLFIQCTTHRLAKCPPKDFSECEASAQLKNSGWVFLSECELIPSHPSITINGKQVEFFDNHIKVGCKTIYSDSIKRLYGAVSQWNSNTTGVPIHGIDFTSDGAIVSSNDLRQISEHFSK
jgi:hypothetical protein